MFIGRGSLDTAATLAWIAAKIIGVLLKFVGDFRQARGGACLILLAARRAADTDTAQYVVADLDRHPAGEREHSGEVLQPGRPRIADQRGERRAGHPERR